MPMGVTESSRLACLRDRTVEGRGTPLNDDRKEWEPSVPMAAPTLGPNEIIKILFLVDNPGDARLCVRALEDAELNVEIDMARSSREFVEFARSRVYDVVVADFRLPDWDGLDTLQSLRSLGRDTPVILVTGNLTAKRAIECIKAGVSDYILKEDLERLPVAVRRALDEHNMLQSRDRAQSAQSESEKQYRLLFNANPDPMWVFDRETLQFLTVNDAAIRHYGYSLNEFLLMTLRDLTPPEEMGRFLAAVVPDRSGVSTLERWKHRTKDGTIIDVEINSQEISFRSVEAVLVAAHDVTARRRAEIEIRESKEQLQLMLESTAEAIYAIDMNGICTLCNPACFRGLGYVHESEVIGKDMHALVHHTRPDGSRHPAEECKIHQALRDGTKVYVENELFWRADRTCFPVEYWSYPIFRDTKAIGSVVTFFDITERKKSVEQLRRSESRYRSIIENAPYGICRVDQNGKITMANQALLAMLGYHTADEVLGLDMATQVYSDPQERERMILESSADPSLGYETKWIRKDGKAIIVRVAGRLIAADDELSGGYESFVEDVTETKSLQTQFEHAQKMEAVGRLAGGVAHDFNNLLMVVSGYAQLLDESSHDAVKVTEYVRQIHAALSKAAAITLQLLAFSRKQVVDPTLLDLNFIVSDIGKMLPRLLGEDVDLTMALEPELGTVRADRTQIEQVIVNLAVNARDAMPKGGQITVETRNVDVDAGYSRQWEVNVPRGRYVSLTVSDSGIGMSAETQLRIFEPFFTTKEVGKGTGLGLATVYAIVKQSHGFIWVYSELGKGSSFKIYLPRLDAAPAREQSLQAEVTRGGTETILLTEDDPDLREVSRVYLESKGYTVLEAANANDALKVCTAYQQPIHLLITDMVMPGRSGLDLAKAALEIRPTLTVVLMSGYTDRMLDISSIGFEARFLQKPFSLDALARLTRALLDTKKQPGQM
jgi:two-component system cell cycle sensor histidine kinase/response regulator CckA